MRKFIGAILWIIGVAVLIGSIGNFILQWTGHTLGLVVGLAFIILASFMLSKKKESFLAVVLFLVGFVLLIDATSALLFSITGNFWGVVIGALLLFFGGWYLGKMKITVVG